MILWSFEPEDLLLPSDMNPLNPSNITGLVASFQFSFLALCTSDRHGEIAYSPVVTEFSGKVTGWQPGGVTSTTHGMAGTKRRPLPAKWLRARVCQARHSPGDKT